MALCNTSGMCVPPGTSMVTGLAPPEAEDAVVGEGAAPVAGADAAAAAEDCATDGAGFEDVAGAFCAGGMGPPSWAHAGADIPAKRTANAVRIAQGAQLFIEFPRNVSIGTHFQRCVPHKSRCLKGNPNASGLTTPFISERQARIVPKTRPCMNTARILLLARSADANESILVRKRP
jgi:hypothetical protein